MTAINNYANFTCDKSSPIGVFDSGLGGLTVLKSILSNMPDESTIYFGDNGRTPYGTKSHETILRYSIQDSNFLLSQGVKMIVIACNTASSHAYRHLAGKLPVPVVEVITPGAQAAVKSTRNGKIGIIGTSATVSSYVYEKAILEYAQHFSDRKVQVYSKACPLFVSLAEEGWWDNDIALLTAQRYLSDLKTAGIDTLVLGCTHYPLLTDTIAKVMGSDVALINSADAVVTRIKEELAKTDCEAPAGNSINKTSSYYTSDSVEKFRALGSSFLGIPVENAAKVEIEKYADTSPNYRG